MSNIFLVVVLFVLAEIIGVYIGKTVFVKKPVTIGTLQLAKDHSEDGTELYTALKMNPAVLITLHDGDYVIFDVELLHADNAASTMRK